MSEIIVPTVYEEGIDNDRIDWIHTKERYPDVIFLIDSV